MYSLQLLKLCKGRKHFLDSGCVKIHGHLKILRAVLHTEHSPLSKLDMADPVAHTVIQSCRLLHGKGLSKARTYRFCTLSGRGSIRRFPVKDTA